MARPPKLNAEYFSHDADMRNDAKIKAVRKKFGHLGYSIWCMLLEALTNANDFILDWDELNIELIAGDFDIESEELIPIISYFQKLKMIQIESDQIWCQKLVDRFEGLLSKRKRTRKGVMDVHNTPQAELLKQKDVQNPQSKVKESKVNNSIVKESKEINKEAIASAPTSSEIILPIKTEEEKRKKTPPKKRKAFIAPTKEEFTQYAIEKCLDNDLNVSRNFN